MKKKIGLFLTARPLQGGSFQYNLSMLDAVPALRNKRFEVIVGYAHNLWLEKILDKGLRPLKISLGLLGRLGAGKLISGMLPIKMWRTFTPFFHPVVKTIVNQKCDLWVFPTQDTWTYLIPVPAIGTIYDLMHRYQKQFPEVSDHGQFQRREKHYMNICKWSAGILVDSQVGKQHVVESYQTNPNKIHVLPFVAPKYIQNDDRNSKTVNRYNLPEKYFFYPAQFWEHKNHKSLLKAMADLKKEVKDLNFVFVGSPYNGYESTIALSKELNLMNNIKILGYVPDHDMPALYRRSRALIMPTFFGPTNIPPLEAMTLDCPVAISDIFGTREQLGDAAIYFNPESIDEIKNAMKLLWTDDSLCRNLSKKGVIQSARWNQERFNKKFESIINRVLTVTASA
jgi:glycosyltransferase involved in cell wall biosynthesis